MWHRDPHARSLRLAAVIVLALASGVIASARASTAPASPPPTALSSGELYATLSSTELTLGAATSVTGRLAAGVAARAGVALALQADPYPYGRFATLAHATSSADGSFSFDGIRPDRNTRLRVVGEGVPSSASRVLEVTVDPRILGGARSLGPGRVRLTIRVRHAITEEKHAAAVRWFLGARGSRVFRLAANTVSRELAPGVTYASVVVDPPFKRFVWRACMNPSWEGAMGTAWSHRRCPEATFVAGRDAR
ncbi:MAG TPA: hypothetical protein VHY83_08985 [Solirubrobacteraceae bacterium]|jgi:hypothetical protein|nr:hypothetical protein [Solirubrobacteraceae bacterium]